MKTTQHTQTKAGYRPSLYFCRWTRSHAAVFRSLGRCVVIGHLAVSILEQLAGKSLGLLREFTDLQLASSAQELEEQEAEALSVSEGLDGLLATAHPSLGLLPQFAESDFALSPH